MHGFEKPNPDLGQCAQAPLFGSSWSSCPQGGCGRRGLSCQESCDFGKGFQLQLGALCPAEDGDGTRPPTPTHLRRGGDSSFSPAICLLIATHKQHWQGRGSCPDRCQEIFLLKGQPSDSQCMTRGRVALDCKSLKPEQQGERYRQKNLFQSVQHTRALYVVGDRNTLAEMITSTVLRSISCI